MASEISNELHHYDIDQTIKVINHEGAKRVALQFPDSLLSDADKVTSVLRSQLSDDVELYILGDTTVCPCCVDTVAVEHIKADLVIHYGDACMSRVEDIPVFYAFEHSAIDIDSCVQIIRERFGGTKKPIYLGYDLSFYHCISELYEALREYCPSLLLGEIKRSQNLSDSVKFETGYSKLGYHYFSTTSIDRDGILLFIGKDGIQCSNYYDNGNVYSMLVDSGISQSFVYADYQLQSINLNKYLMQRYVQIERFENLEMIGVIAGTLSVYRYREIINHISNLAEEHDQALYTFMVGKLNLPKLANFPGIEGFVLIGCERSCFIDTREYPFPIITPYEYEISIQERSWEDIYIHDYTKLLGDKIEVVEEKSVEEDLDHSYDGRIIAFESRVLDYINEQHYAGLEQKGDVDTPAVLKKGLKGIPSCYDKEVFY